MAYHNPEQLLDPEDRGIGTLVHGKLFSVAKRINLLWTIIFRRSGTVLKFLLLGIHSLRVL